VYAFGLESTGVYAFGFVSTAVSVRIWFGVYCCLSLLRMHLAWSPLVRILWSILLCMHLAWSPLVRMYLVWRLLLFVTAAYVFGLESTAVYHYCVCIWLGVHWCVCIWFRVYCCVRTLVSCLLLCIINAGVCCCVGIWFPGALDLQRYRDSVTEK
jgi:hypothetical protein